MVALEGALTEPQQRRRRRAFLVTLLIALIVVAVLFAAFVVRDGFSGGSSAGHGSGSTAHGTSGLPKGTGRNSNNGGAGGGLANIGSDSPLVFGGDAIGLLTPGSTSPIDLTITNRAGRAVAVDALSVSISSVSAPRATATYPCTASDYVLSQFVSAGGVIAPAFSTVTLSSLGFARSAWPSVTMALSTSDQRGCSGATVSLAYQMTETH